MVAARNAYVRVQAVAHESRFEDVPIFRDFVDNLQSDEVTTVDFTAAFGSKSKSFLAGWCPLCETSTSGPLPPDLRIEVSFVRASYRRVEKELRLLLTFRILGAGDTVLYAKAVSVDGYGDILADQSIVDRALNLGFERLGGALSHDMGRIMENVRFNEMPDAELAAILSASARARGGLNSSPSQRAGGRMLAILIGIGDYPPALRGLRYAAEDATHLFGLLTDRENRLAIGGEDAVLLTDRQATARNIREALSRWLLRNERPDDTVLVYFAGHGTYGVSVSEDGRQEKYFYPVDYDQSAEDPFDTAIPMSEVIDYFGRLQARNVIMIFDACSAAAAAEEQDGKELSRFVQMRSGQKLNVVMAASAAGEKSYEDSGGGLFTTVLTQGLHGSADGEAGPAGEDRRDGIVTIAEAASFAVARVPYVAGRHHVLQHPMWRTNDAVRAAALGFASFPEARSNSEGK